MKAVMDRFVLERFEYGVTDCCQFVAACVEHITGSNPIAGLEYNGEAEAAELIQRFGSLELAISAVLGYQPYGGRKDGDVALVESKGEQFAAVAYGRMDWMKSEDGVIALPPRFAKCYWKT